MTELHKLMDELERVEPYAADWSSEEEELDQIATQVESELATQPGDSTRHGEHYDQEKSQLGRAQLGDGRSGLNLDTLSFAHGPITRSKARALRHALMNLVADVNHEEEKTNVAKKPACWFNVISICF